MWYGFFFCRSAVAVKLIRAQNDHHAKHIDGFFCTATIRHLEELASMLGPNEVCFVSQDDKACVTIWLVTSKVQLWFTSSDNRNKLIPCVYAGIQIQSNDLKTEKLLVIRDRPAYQSDLENTLHRQHSVMVLTSKNCVLSRTLTSSQEAVLII